MTIKGIPKNNEFLNLIIELVKLFKPGTYVELGVKRGFIFNRISPLVQKAVAVDSCGFKGVNASDNVAFFHMTTDEFATIWEGTIDMLFIDADHSKRQVLKDIDNMLPFIRDYTGLILLHDTYPINEPLTQDGYCSNAWEAAHEIRVTPRYFSQVEIVTLPGPFFGLSILRKVPFSGHLEWKGAKE